MTAEKLNLVFTGKSRGREQAGNMFVVFS